MPSPTAAHRALGGRPRTPIEAAEFLATAVFLVVLGIAVGQEVVDDHRPGLLLAVGLFLGIPALLASWLLVRRLAGDRAAVIGVRLCAVASLIALLVALWNEYDLRTAGPERTDANLAIIPAIGFAYFAFVGAAALGVILWFDRR